MKKELQVLMVEDQAPDMVLINHALRKAGLRCRARRVDSREAFLHELAHHPPDVILSDHGVPGFDGFSALAEARTFCPDVPFIFVTGAPGTQAAEETVRSGADDYVLKNHLHLLGPAIERALRDSRSRIQQRQLQAALLNAQEHLNLLIAEVEEYSSFLVDQDGSIASWNPGAERMFGLEPHEALEKNFGIILDSGELNGKTAAELLVLAIEHGRIEDSGWCIRRDRREFRVRIVIAALRNGWRKPNGFLCVIHDQSRRESGDPPAIAPDHAARLQADNREMEQFTYAIAKDLREPLRIIEGFAEKIQKSAGEKLDQKNRGHLKTIVESSHRMSRLVDDLFGYTRIRSVEMHRLHLSLNEIATEVIHDLRPETEDREIEWTVGDLPEVEGDPVMMWMVMNNLISNALKFTRPRRIAKIEIGCRTDPDGHVIFVRDNGVGFDMQHASKLFQIFQRLHGDDFPGTGVGLANVRRIIQRHGGRTWAESVEGEGATFYFFLPRIA